MVWWCASDRAAREVMTDRNAKKQKQKVGYVVWLDSAQTRAQAQAQTRTHPAADEREGARWGRARHDERWYVWGSSLSIWPPPVPQGRDWSAVVFLLVISVGFLFFLGLSPRAISCVRAVTEWGFCFGLWAVLGVWWVCGNGCGWMCAGCVG